MNHKLAELFSQDIENIVAANKDGANAEESALFRPIMQGEFEFSTIGDSYVMITWQHEGENIIYTRTPLAYEQFKSFIGKGKEYIQSQEVKGWQERSESTIIVMSTDVEIGAGQPSKDKLN